MLYNFPLRIPKDRRVTLTQPFKSTEMVAWYKSQGINITEHTGVDVVCGDSWQTYGTPFVCPFTKATLHAKQVIPGTTSDQIMVQIRHVDWKGRELILGGLHLSELSENTGFLEGDVIGYLGNSGAVSPKPTILNPAAGTHLHMTLRVDGVLTDPLTFFDLQNPYRGEDTGMAKDMPAAHWAVRELLRLIESMTGKPIEEVVFNNKNL